MRIAALLLLLSFTAAGQNQPTAPASPADENARKARALLDQCITALGGTAWLNIQDMEQEGRTYGFSRQGESGTGVPFWRSWKWPDKDRIELTKQRDWVIIHNGDAGFETTFRGTHPEDKEALRGFLERRHYSLEFVLRRWINEPGTMFFYDGQTVAERKQADQVTVLNAANEAATLYLDMTTHLPIKKSYTVRDPETREKNVEEEIYDNYHTVQGIPTPYDTARSHNGRPANQRFLNVVRYNTGVPDAKFVASTTALPAPAAPQKK
jgi:hypothetical protein